MANVRFLLAGLLSVTLLMCFAAPSGYAKDTGQHDGLSVSYALLHSPATMVEVACLVAVDKTIYAGPPEIRQYPERKGWILHTTLARTSPTVARIVHINPGLRGC